MWKPPNPTSRTHRPLVSGCGQCPESRLDLQSLLEGCKNYWNIKSRDYWRPHYLSTSSALFLVGVLASLGSDGLGRGKDSRAANLRTPKPLQPPQATSYQSFITCPLSCTAQAALLKQLAWRSRALGMSSAGLYVFLLM